MQDDTRSAPFIPSLTPVGFAQWMTLHILAYPDEEARRLDKVVLAMPIDADGDLVDGKPERLPKQISRYLLPARPDPKSRKLLDNAMNDYLADLGSSSRRKASITSSPSLGRRPSTTQSRRPVVEIHQDKTSPNLANANPLERERKPYAGTPAASESASSEEPIKIERDRAPYTAKEGSGKVYAESDNLNASSRPGRANSTSNRNSTRAQANVPEPHHTRAPSNSSQTYVPPLRSGGRRSPPMKGFSSSTPNDIHLGSKYDAQPSPSSSSFNTQPQSFNPGSYGSNSSFPPPPPPADAYRRSRDERMYRRDPDDELRSLAEFNSPRDAEKWDRYQDVRGSEPDRFDRPYDRTSMPNDPRDLRGAPLEEWYRENGRGPDYEPFGRRY